MHRRSARRAPIFLNPSRIVITSTSFVDLLRSAKREGFLATDFKAPHEMLSALTSTTGIVRAQMRSIRTLRLMSPRLLRSESMIEIAGTSPAMTRIFVLIQNDGKPL
jgi:hypothetical protein